MLSILELCNKAPLVGGQTHWYESGLGTTNFTTDDLFKQSCDEDLLHCHGKLYTDYGTEAPKTVTKITPNHYVDRT